jgi:hypothetical protein
LPAAIGRLLRAGAHPKIAAAIVDLVQKFVNGALLPPESLTRIWRACLDDHAALSKARETMTTADLNNTQRLALCRSLVAGGAANVAGEIAAKAMWDVVPPFVTMLFEDFGDVPFAPAISAIRAVMEAPVSVSGEQFECFVLRRARELFGRHEPVGMSTAIEILPELCSHFASQEMATFLEEEADHPLVFGPAARGICGPEHS